MRYVISLLILFCLPLTGRSQYHGDLKLADLGLADNLLSREAARAYYTHTEWIIYRDPNPQPIQSIYWNWNPELLDWNLLRRDLYNYNPNQALINSIAQNWFENEWVDQYRAVYTYTPQHLLRMFQFEFWDGTNWHLYVRFLHTYDTQGRLICFTTQDWLEDKWVDRYRREYQYLTSPACIEILRQDAWQNEWYNKQKEKNYLTPHGDTYVQLLYDWIGQSWSETYQTTHHYNELQQLTDKYFASNYSGEWKNVWHQTFSYDPHGQIIADQTLYADPSPNDQNIAYTYDYDDQANSMIRTCWTETDSVWNPRDQQTVIKDSYERITSELFTRYDQSWVNEQYIEHSYIETTSTATPKSEPFTALYPNPAQTDLFFSIPDPGKMGGIVTIRTLDGRSLQSQPLDASLVQKINVAFLSDGMYLLQAKTSGGVISDLFTIAR